MTKKTLGAPDNVIVEVTLDRHDDETLEIFEKALAKMPEVLEAYLLTGDFDYSIKIAVAGTEGYEKFLREKLYKIPGIRHTRSEFYSPLPQANIFKASSFVSQ